MKRVLTPAVETFKETGQLPDVFSRYDLPLDVSNAGEIEAAVRAASAFWIKQKNNGKYTRLVERLTKDAGLNGKNDLRTLLDDKAREEQKAVVEEERRKQRESRFDELKSSIGVLAAKGYITPLEKAGLVARFLKAGFMEDEIKSHIRVPEREGAKKLPTDQGLESVIRNQLRTNLATLKKRDLYEFLDIGPNAKPEDIKRRYTELYTEWDRRPNDFIKSAAQVVLGVVQTHLSGGMAKYEAARVYDILDRLRPEVKLAAIDKRISREEFNHLLALVTKQGLEKTLATEFILSLAEDCGAAVEWGMGEETIRCSNCSADRPKKEEKCTACGADLWTDCPKCKTRLPISESACGKCGFVVAHVLRVRLLVRKAQLALDDGAITEALTHAREAERLWGRQDDVAAVMDKISKRQREVEGICRRLDEALAGKQLFSARGILGELARTAPDYSGRDGKTVEDLRNKIDARLNQVETALKSARLHEQGKRMEEAVFAYQEALQLAADAEEARQGLSRCPPDPPRNVRAAVHGNHVLVEWAASRAVGNLEYLVVRSEGRAPAAPDDGENIARTSASSCRDQTARPGKSVFYSVFTERGGTISAAAATGGVLVAREVATLKLEAGDSIVRGAWDFDGGECRVRVFCREGSAPDRQTGREVALASPQNFMDAQVSNGRLYYYRVLVEYRDAQGQSVFTPGVVASIKPEQPPRAVEHLLVTFDEGTLTLMWAVPPHGKVSIYRAPRAPEWKSGAQIPIENLSGLGMRLQSKSESQAVDTSPPNTPAYYVPVTIAGDVAVVGTTRRFVALPDVSKLVAEDFGQYLQLRWEWPPGCQSALVTWRPDAFPQDAYDTSASKREISKGEYERQGGFRIEAPAKSAYKFAVFAATKEGGETVYSASVREGSRAELRTAPPIAVSYRLSRGTFRRGRFTLTLSGEQAVSKLPDVVVVMKRGDLQPLRSDDGSVVASFGGASLTVGGEAQFQFELNGAQRPVYLRLFFRDAASYQSYRLIDPPPEQLRVR
ncbi:MAG TPA: zinc ribbon domain-containing protein [Pyrinomonadaceae bacterium]